MGWAKQFPKVLRPLLKEHKEHGWYKAGRCVYCGRCGVRLYQGRVPDGHPIHEPQRTMRNDPATEMLKRFGKDV